MRPVIAYKQKVATVMRDPKNNGPVYALVGLTFGLVMTVSIVTILAPGSADVDRVINFVGGIVPVILGYVFLNGKVNATIVQNEELKAQNEGIESHVNGKLDEKFKTLNARLDILMMGTSPIPAAVELTVTEPVKEDDDAAASA